MQLAGQQSSSSPRLGRVLSTLSATFWILALGIIALFAFLVALGAFKPAEVVGVSIVVGVLVVLWVAHAVWESRHRAPGRDPAATRDRERRGF